MSGYPGQGYGPGGHYPPHGGPPPNWGGNGQWGPPPQQGYGAYNQGPQHAYPPQQQQYQHPQQGYGGHQQQQYHHQQPPQQYGGGGRAPFIPQGMQHNGQQNFQFSNCNGRRKALLIGINYFGQNGELKGCINDVQNLSSFLVENFGYKREDMVILRDDYPSNDMRYPSREHIIRAMNWLVNGARENDSLFLHYSGHGGQTEDQDGDEDDGYDEVIYPVDYKRAGHIVDDEIHSICVGSLQAGVRLTAIFDSCHSGSVLDLPYMYSTEGKLKEANFAKDAGEGFLKAAKAGLSSGNFAGAALSGLGSFMKEQYIGDKARKKSKETKASPADAICFSGSKDDQTSADATIASQATGAMSHAFITAFNANRGRDMTYQEFLIAIREVLAEGSYKQKPQLTCSHPLDITQVKFIM